MAIESTLKKKVIEDWQLAFPQLTKYAQNKLYKVIGPTVVGIELIKLPHSEEYRPHFVSYPLWEKDIKRCLNYPFVLQQFYDDKNLQYNIPYENNDKFLFQDVVKNVWLQSPVNFEGNISLNNLLLCLDKYAKKAPMLSSQDSRMFGLFMEAKMKIALYLNADLAANILNEIKNHHWDRDHFKAFNADVEIWLNKLSSEINDRDEFLKQIEINKKDKKIAKLQSSELIP